MTKNKSRTLMANFEPILTYHALVRISGRLAPRTKKQANVIVGNCCISGEFEAGWVSPSLIREVMEDARNSIYGKAYYNPKKGLVVEGKLAWYVFGSDRNIITIMTTLEKEYREEMSEGIDFKFRVKYLGIGQDMEDFKVWRDRKRKEKLLYYK